MAWQVDTSHSQITFTVRHMMFAKVRGNFEKYSATVNFDEKNPSSTTVYAEIDVASVNTREAQRDGHLKSPDFFEVEKYPTMVFRSKRVEQKDAHSGKLIGDLTIRDVTKEVVLDVEYSGIAKNPWGMEMAGFSGKTVINRKDWGLNWNAALEAGGVLVGEDVTIEIDLEIVKAPETAAA